MLQNGKSKECCEQKEYNKSHEPIPNHTDTIEFFEVSYESCEKNVKLIGHTLEVTKGEIVKLREGFESWNTRENFDMKAFTVGDVSEHIGILYAHWILKVFSGKGIFYIPDFAISREIIGEQATCSDDAIIFFLCYVYPGLCTTRVSDVIGKKEERMVGGLQLGTNLLEKNIVGHNDHHSWHQL